MARGQLFGPLLRNTFSLDGLEFTMMTKHLPGFSVHNFDKGNTKTIRDQIVSSNRKFFYCQTGNQIPSRESRLIDKIEGRQVW